MRALECEADSQRKEEGLKDLWKEEVEEYIQNSD